jgi:hypothetical protein
MTDASALAGSTRIGGLALALGGVLNFLRNAVNIGLSEGIDFSRLPASTVEDAVWAGGLAGWEPSHRLALASAPLLLFGTVSAYRALARNDGEPWALAGASGLAITLVLYTVATVLDGFGLPILAADHAAAPAELRPTLGWMALASHQLACTLGGSAFGGFSLSVGFFGMAVYRVHGLRWYAMLAGILSVVAGVGYASGLLSLTLVKTGLTPVLALTHGAYALLVVLGVWMWRGFPSAEVA